MVIKSGRRGWAGKTNLKLISRLPFKVTKIMLIKHIQAYTYIPLLWFWIASMRTKNKFLNSTCLKEIWGWGEKEDMDPQVT